MCQVEFNFVQAKKPEFELVINVAPSVQSRLDRKDRKAGSRLKKGEQRNLRLQVGNTGVVFVLTMVSLARATV